MNQKRPAGIVLVWIFTSIVAIAWPMQPVLCADGRGVATAPSASEVKIEQNVMVPMRDGVKLATDLYHPAGNGPFPVILARTPYAKGGFKSQLTALAKEGYVGVAQDCRGRFDSEGEWSPFTHEQNDGKDTVKWILSQPWCNGKIGMMGGSYVGYTQWALAPGNTDVDALTPTITVTSAYDAMHSGGAFYQLTWVTWSIVQGGRSSRPDAAKNLKEGLKHLPLIDADNASFEDVGFYNNWVKRPVPDDYWASISVTDKISEISAPMLLITGWYDIFVNQQIREFELVLENGQPQVKAGTKLIVGPWDHMFNNVNAKNYDLDLITEGLKVQSDIKQWFDYALKGEPNGWDKRAPIRIYVLGANVWRDEQEYPLARTVYTNYYLRSDGKANSLSGDGVLDLEKPEGTPTDTLTFDPMNPVPTLGGKNVGADISGPADQQEIEKRDDVLVYSTAPLEKPLEVTGPVKLTLFASSDAPDTDFTGKLVDVCPDGKCLILSDGILRARYRNGLSKPEFLEPAKVYQFDIDMGCTSVLFQTGHRIRLEVSSSNFPRFDRNPNTGTDIARESKTRTAHQNIWHNDQYPSHVTLPLIPR